MDNLFNRLKYQSEKLTGIFYRFLSYFWHFPDFKRITNENGRKEVGEFKSHIDVEMIFDAYCKQVLGNKLIDYKRRENYRRNNEVSLFYLSAKESIATEDEYFVHVIKVDNEEYLIQDEDLHIALNNLTEDKCKIILFYYYDRMTDGEIAKILDLPRTTIQYKRRTALDTLCELILGGRKNGD
ncbi:MAG: sigma-70 family RNA polymerase sigma factor [Clostridiales bacterium]|nr:sigma-70 family RNA polymerase sigma factor [Clostridiales bacterium]